MEVRPGTEVELPAVAELAPTSDAMCVSWRLIPLQVTMTLATYNSTNVVLGHT